MSFTRSRVATLLAVMAALALLAAAPMAVSAASTTLAGDGTDTVTGFDASPDDHLEYSIPSDDTDFGTDGTSEVRLNVSYDGITHAETSSDVASGDASHLFNLSHSALSTLPGSPGETITVNVTAYGTDGAGTTTTGPTEFTVDITFAESYGNIFLADGSTDYDNAEITEGELGLLASATNAVPFTEDDEATDNVEIERTETLADGDEINVDFQAEDTTAAFSDTVGSFDSAGDPVLGMTVMADDTYVPVFNSEAPEYFDTTETHATYDTANDELTFNAGSDFDSASEETDLYVASADPFADVTDADVGFDDIRDNFDSSEVTLADYQDAFGVLDIGVLNYFQGFGQGLWPFTIFGSGTALLGGGLVVSRRQVGS